MVAVEYLAAIGLAALGGDHVVAARALLAHVEPTPGRAGVEWMPTGDGRTRITWPDRVPGLVVWSGRQTLARLIRDTQAMLRAGLDRPPGRQAEPQAIDLFAVRAPRDGVSGLDSTVCWTALDVGWSPAAQGIPVRQRPGIELLAILGLETVPLVSFARRMCGFVHDGRIWQIEIRPRGEHGYYQWGRLREWSLPRREAVPPEWCEE